MLQGEDSCGRAYGPCGNRGRSGAERIVQNSPTFKQVSLVDKLWCLSSCIQRKVNVAHQANENETNCPDQPVEWVLMTTSEDC